MDNFVLMLLFTSGYMLLLFFSLKHLPRERWQILASMPVRQKEDHSWTGINFTYYGFILSTAVVMATSLFMVLMLSMGLDLQRTTLIAMMGLGIGVPAAKIMARVVEKKKHTLTVGGAFFVVLLCLPAALNLCNSFFSTQIPIIPSLAALMIAFSLGEGLGRLACVSFGCCYGRSINSCHPFFQFLFSRWATIFRGSTKKVAYEGKLEGVPLVPVQALSSIVNGLLFLAGTALFVQGYYLAAFILCLTGTQLWRIISEFFRADFRGRNRLLSWYQVMSLIAVVGAVLLVILLPAQQMRPVQLIEGLLSIWNPLAILLFQALWVAVFYYTGKSMVTGATMNFHINHHLV